MKVFNINNPKAFIEKIVTNCHGRIELVNEDGMHIELTDGNVSADMLPFSYMRGSIDEMELCFSDNRDAVMILSYLAHMPLAAS